MRTPITFQDGNIRSKFTNALLRGIQEPTTLWSLFNCLEHYVLPILIIIDQKEKTPMQESCWIGYQGYPRNNQRVYNAILNYIG